MRGRSQWWGASTGRCLSCRIGLGVCAGISVHQSCLPACLFRCLPLQVKGVAASLLPLGSSA